MGNVKLVDISTQGVLVETTAKIARGTAIELQLIGDGINVSAAARVTRSEVASVDGLGVRYQIAASFSRELEIPGIEQRLPPAVAGPSELAELLAHALRDVDSRSTSARVTFEHGLRRLLSAVDVQIRHSAVVPERASESIYFTIPSATARKPILQAVFEPNRPPSPAQFKLLRAAAALAAVILEFSSVDESAPGVSG